jgi:hypothetical protein
MLSLLVTVTWSEHMVWLYNVSLWAQGRSEDFVVWGEAGGGGGGCKGSIYLTFLVT